MACNVGTICICLSKLRIEALRQEAKEMGISLSALVNVKLNMADNVNSKLNSMLEWRCNNNGNVDT